MSLSSSASAPIELRLAVDADVAAIRELIARSVRGLAQGIYSPEQIDLSLIHVFGVDTQLIADKTYYVAESAGRIVAAGGWSARETLYGGDQAKHEADPLVDPLLAPARIRAFFVDPGWARRGLARRIFENCEHAASARGFRWFVLAATLPGIPLYAALGFTAHERIEVPLPEELTLPCVRMERRITGA
jgi:GNAT superfamily N-acetyltransferase